MVFKVNLCLIVIVQVLDAILTYFGMLKFGIAMEGNPMYRYLFSQFGVVAPLVVIKSLVMVAIYILYLLRDQSPKMVLFGMIFVNVFYMGAAIIPWTVVLLTL